MRAQVGKQKAIVAITRKLLVVIWYVLSKREVERHADPPAIARSLMKWAARQRIAASNGQKRLDFVWRELDRLGLSPHINQGVYNGHLYVV